MQNPIQKFRQSSIVFQKPGILPEKLKVLTSSNYLQTLIIFVETLHTFPTYQCLQKDVWDIFILFRTWVISQNQKIPSFYTLTETSFIKIRKIQFLTQDLHKIRKTPHIRKTEMCAKFQQKILNFTVVGAHQSFQFFRLVAWFFGNARANN